VLSDRMSSDPAKACSRPFYFCRYRRRVMRSVRGRKRQRSTITSECFDQLAFGCLRALAAKAICLDRPASALLLIVSPVPATYFLLDPIGIFGPTVMAACAALFIFGSVILACHHRFTLY
jgi:hypothetical protein